MAQLCDHKHHIFKLLDIIARIAATNRLPASPPSERGSAHDASVNAELIERIPDPDPDELKSEVGPPQALEGHRELPP